MISEEKKFISEVRKYSAFALMSPFGRYFFILSDIKKEDLTVLFFIHLALSFILFCLGYIMLQKAYEEIRGE